jgi:hypothetical protein
MPNVCDGGMTERYLGATTRLRAVRSDGLPLMSPAVASAASARMARAGSDLHPRSGREPGRERALGGPPGAGRGAPRVLRSAPRPACRARRRWSRDSLPNAVAAVYLASRGRGAATLSEAFNGNAINILVGSWRRARSWVLPIRQETCGSSPRPTCPSRLALSDWPSRDSAWIVERVRSSPSAKPLRRGAWRRDRANHRHDCPIVCKSTARARL